MSLADDLRTLQELHEKGKLTDQEYADAKANTLAGTKQSADRPVTTSRRLGRSIGMVAIPLLVVALLVLGFAWYQAGTRATTQFIATAVHAPITVLDEVQNIPASSWKGIPLNFPSGGTVEINLQVVRGNPVDVFLTTPDQIDAMNKEDWKSVKTYGEFNATKTQTYRRTGNLGPGSYYLVMRDTSLGILSSSATDMSVKVVLTP